MKKVVHHFGSYRIDIAARQLWRSDQSLSVSAVMFDLIAYLLQHRDHAVGRDELVAAVWGSTEVSDSVFAKTLFKCRRVLGDSGDEQGVIRTVPRFGFHWVAPVRVESWDGRRPPSPNDRPAPAVPSPPASSTGARAERTQDARRFGSLLPWLAMPALLAVVLSVPLLTSQRPEADIQEAAVVSVGREPAAAGVGRIAVLPVEVEAAPEDAWLRFGVMDMVANRLREAGAPVVASEMVVRVMGEDGAVDTPSLKFATGVERLVAISLRHGDGEWAVGLSFVEPSRPRQELLVNGDDPLTAARAAADALLAGLGLIPADRAESAEAVALSHVLQRVQAALLAGDVSEARRRWTALSEEQKGLPEARLRRGLVEYRAGEIETAHELFSALAVDLERIAPGERLFHGRVWSALGTSARILNRMPEARDALDHAIRLLEADADLLQLGRAYVARAVLLGTQGRYLEGGNDIGRARVVFQSSGDAFELAMADYIELLLAGSTMRPHDALASFENLAARFEQFGAVIEQAHILGNQALAQVNLLRCRDALRTSDRAFALLDRIQNSRARHQIRHARAVALSCAGRMNEADALFSRLESDVVPVHEDNLLASVRVHRAEFERASGRVGDARISAQWVRDHALTPDLAPIRASGWYELVRSDLEAGALASALAEADAFSRWADQSADSTAQVYAHLARARSLAANGAAGEATGWNERAWRQVEREGLPVDRKVVAEAYGPALLAAGSTDRAIEVIGRIGHFAEQEFGAALLQVELHRFLGHSHAWRRSLDHARSLAGERSIPGHLELTLAAASPERP